MSKCAPPSRDRASSGAVVGDVIAMYIVIGSLRAVSTLLIAWLAGAVNSAGENAMPPLLDS